MGKDLLVEDGDKGGQRGEFKVGEVLDVEKRLMSQLTLRSLFQEK